MTRIIYALLFLGYPVSGYAQGLTPEDLKAKIDAQTAQVDPFQAMLNDPDPTRSLLAVQFMLDSGELPLMRMAVDFGLQSAVPEVKRAAIIGFLKARPVLQLQLKAPEDDVANFEDYLRGSTNGSVLPDGSALYSVNIGEFDADKNCFLGTGTEYCVLEVGPAGVTIRYPTSSSVKTTSNLTFDNDSNLTGSTSVAGYAGGIPTTLTISQ